LKSISSSWTDGIVDDDPRDLNECEERDFVQRVPGQVHEHHGHQEGERDADSVLGFVRDVGSDDLNKAWDEGFENNAASQLPALQERIATFKGWMTDVKAGQQLRFVLTPGAGTRVEADGADRGTIEGDDFAVALLSIWLDEKPPNPDLKDGLLGGKCK
jgi:hypothetical protein